MNVFVSEWVTGGGMPDPTTAPSLLREGSSMLCSLLADLLLIPELQLVTTRAAGLPPLEPILTSFLSPRQTADSQLFRRLRVETVTGVEDEQAAFRRLVNRADRLVLIAPETDNILTDRHRTALQENVAAASRLSSPDAIALCSDKLRLADQLAAADLPVIPALRPGSSGGTLPPVCPLNFPVVLKPGDGAGCVETHVFHTPEDYHVFRSQELARQAAGEPRPKWILSPFLQGDALSTAALIHRDSGEVSVFPVGTQRLHIGRRIEYQGGELPATGWRATLQQAAEQLVRNTIRVIPELNGYVGFDLLQTGQPAQPLVLVEINPRLTTAWLGYRQLTASRGQLAGLLAGVHTGPLPGWHTTRVRFLPDGTLISPLAESC